MQKLIVFFGCALLAACHRPEERLYVSAEQSDEVVVVDPQRAEVVARIKVGKRPRGLKVSRDSSRLYVAQSGSPRGGPGVDESKLPPADRGADGIGEVDLASGRMVRTLPGGQDPENFDLSHDGNALYIANEETAELSKLDLSSGKVTERIPAGKQPEGVAVRPDGAVVYVTSEEDDCVTAIDTRTNKELARIDTGKRPRAIAFSRDGAAAFVTNEMSASVTVFDTKTNAVLATIPISAGEGSSELQRPMGILRAQGGELLYVSTGRGGGIAQLHSGARKLERLIEKVGARPWGIAESPDGKRLYTANGPSNDLTILDLASGEMKRVAIGGSPWGVVSVTR